MAKQYPDYSQPKNQDKKSYPDYSQQAQQTQTGTSFDDINQMISDMPQQEQPSPLQEAVNFTVPQYAQQDLKHMASMIPLVMGGGLVARGAYGLGKEAIKRTSNLINPENKVAQFAEKEQQAEHAYQTAQDQKAHSFMQQLGSPKTAEENIEEFAKRAYFGRQSAANEALAHKTPVFEALGEQHIIRVPKNAKELKTQHPEFGDFVNEAQVPENISGKLKSAYTGFLKSPTLNNADTLQKQLGSRIGELTKARYRKGALDPAEGAELDALMNSRNHLIRDQENFMAKQKPEYKEQYDLFRKKWNQNVEPYDLHPTLSEMVRRKEGPKYARGEGVTPSDLKSAFQYPSSNAQKVIKDLGPHAKENILYNELQSAMPRGAEDLAKKLSEAKQFGYQKFMTPEMDMLAQELGKGYTKQTMPKISKNIGDIAWDLASGAAAGDILGSPMAGAIYKILRKKQ